MRQKHPNTPLLPIVASIFAVLSSPAFAQTTHTNHITTDEELPSVALAAQTITSVRTKVATTERIGRNDLANAMINDTKDLVRYSTDVGVVDNGRHLKGFAMRGVEGNRVGISIDGVTLPDSEENTLYARYGNFNPSRMSIDTELVRGVSLEKGSNSFNLGSGALGGNVEYHTLNANNLIKAGKQAGILVRTGYASKNNEWVNTVGTAYQDGQLEAVAMYSNRQGHETKSNGTGNISIGSSSQKPDPAKHRQNSYLGKIAWQINPDHRIGILINGQNGKNHTNERSYSLLESAWREADDYQKRTNANIFYEYTPDSTWLAKLKADYDDQRTVLSAINYKGQIPYDWSTKTYKDEKKLDEIYNRSFKTNYQRLSLGTQFLPIRLFGGHTLSAKVHMARRDFLNINHDRIGIGASYETDEVYTIQYPIRTTQFGISLKDNIQWSDLLSTSAGIRYDNQKVAPQELNAQCGKACTAEGKPNSKTFGIWSGFFGMNIQLSPDWKTNYLISSGYRIPTASEMYFSFKNPYGTWKSNPHLKPEHSLSQSLSLQGYGNKGVLDASIYQSQYKDFLFEQTSLIEQTSYGRTHQTPMNQTVNIDKAKILGFELQGKLNLDTVILAPKGLKFYGSLGYSKGKLSTDASLLSIQPIKTVVGLDYEAPSGRWGVFSRLSHLGAKKAKDAQIEDVSSRCIAFEFDDWFGRKICRRTELYKQIITAPYLNRRSHTLDVFGFYKPTDSTTVRAGVYNLLNKKYHTWDALRGINAYGTTNTVDRDGKGLERFYAPGRNFSVSLEYQF
ncbi:TonB-dependent hemoglobin/transferrin/lactoferrin family receptor [Moraxella catarrhalis]|uniref:Outer membrane hemoglobin utilization protein HmbR n=1 Tax=Moraxella catarrhalis TaxID=480 RepID=A0A198UED0_MORCA|nr:TonB-dependent hemoglobin/transferrin/lactoferrin family receptor [Moraxella catarrhalis]OAU94244.1 Outer membrane hemoglobin utilization protein HmbR [Moraxella catarrhalis]OAU94788.1 Outer membrane hemoglobin utilization protein HmbR [Moraxella catarrhalis]OAU99610.1 Outer membrane hemoglobin utilization protein HmbR [Moraxella catarrhalis]